MVFHWQDIFIFQKIKAGKIKMTSFKYKHALIIGGSGMLKTLSLKLKKENAYGVSVLSRRASKAFKKEDQINPIDVDYHNTVEIKDKIKLAIKNCGEIDLVVSWVHSTAPQAAFEIASLLSVARGDFDFFDILGSSAANPANKDFLTVRKRHFLKIPNLNYRQILLGFIIENNQSRWLTNLEISDGVHEAIKNKKTLYTVGTTKPWSLKP